MLLPDEKNIRENISYEFVRAFVWKSSTSLPVTVNIKILVQYITVKYYYRVLTAVLVHKSRTIVFFAELHRRILKKTRKKCHNFFFFGPGAGWESFQ